LEKVAAATRNITLDSLYLKLEEACQIARRKESASGMVAAVTALAKLSGLWVDKTEDLATRAQVEASSKEAASRGEYKTAGALLADAAESLGLPRHATPAQIVGAIAERPVATPEAFALLHEQAAKQ
jgi:hypothetical protein